VAALRELHLFAGAGGGILGGELLGHRCVCAVEIDHYCRSVLVARQNDGSLPPFPIWDDIRTFDGRPWRGVVDVVAGGFPCQDISVAGSGAGIDGERSGLWVEMARVIREVRPRYVFVENSPALVARGLGRVLGDLAEMGFDARWGVVSAADVGAIHRRERIWIVADADSNGLQGRHPDAGIAGEADDSSAGSSPGGVPGQTTATDANLGEQSQCWQIGRMGRSEFFSRFRPWEIASEPWVRRGDHGVAHRVDRLKALGNGQVPRVAATAWRLLSDQSSLAAISDGEAL
jgi:DNA (cytosine-5)-methyltransferase 1